MTITQISEDIEKEKLKCEKCGCVHFIVYCTVIIDDARLYCSNCGHKM